MKKLQSLLTIIVMLLFIAPEALATSPNEAIKVKSANLIVKQNKLRGEVQLCNTEAEDIRFTLEAKNFNINSLYSRNLFLPSATCQKFDIRFDTNFALMSNAGDKIEFVAKSVRTHKLSKKGPRANRYELSNRLSTEVKEGDKVTSDCGDKKSDKNVFELCVGDFAYHEPTGLRIRLNSNDGDKADLLVTHIKWGGVKKVRIYKNRSAEVKARTNKSPTVELTNLIGEGGKEKLYLEIDPR